MDKEQLLREILELEPDLRSKENEVRTLVFSMLEHKPKVFPNVAAKLLIRARLMAEFETGLPKSVPSPWTDWLWYMAPVGVAAVVILMMIPSLPGPTTSFVPGSNIPPVIRSGGGETLTAPKTVPVSPAATKMESAEVAPEADMKMMALPVNDSGLALRQEGELIEVELFSATSAVFSRVVVAEPSFVVVRNVEGGVVFASSDTLAQGVYLGLELSITDKLVPGMYEAFLYRDIGSDNVIESGTDPIVLNADGSPYVVSLGRVE